MNFDFTEDQDALRELARKIFSDQATIERIRACEAACEDGSGEFVVREVWDALAEAQLLGVALPEDVGGFGLGFLELTLLLEEQGRAVAPAPLVPTLLGAAAPIDRFGSDEQRREHLPKIAAGERIYSAALAETDSPDPLAPATRARQDAGTWVLDGVKICVPVASIAHRVLVPAATSDDAVGLFLVDPNAEGVTLERQFLTNRETQYRMQLDGVRVEAADVLGDPNAGREAIAWLVDRVIVGLCAVQVGLADESVQMAARYTIERKQFDRRLASFQAVQQRIADAYINVEAMRVATWRATWWIDSGRPTNEVVPVAKFWCSEGAHDAIYAAQHLHGGIGVDTDYGIFRYHLWSKQLEFTLGGAQASLARLGAELARDDAAARATEPLRKQA